MNVIYHKQAILLAVFLTALQGCVVPKLEHSHPTPVQRMDEIGPARGPKEFHEISEEQALLIAEKEATKRGWSSFEHRNRATRLPDNRWQVFLIRIPRVSGGYSLVQISADGQNVSWYPGM